MVLLVEHVLATKGKAIWSIASDASVYEAINLMAEKEIGALPVPEGERLVGLITDGGLRHPTKHYNIAGSVACARCYDESGYAKSGMSLWGNYGWHTFS